ncbi:phage tail protein I [Vibrio quintilis]|uniref:Phage tail protein (Tail_P2_I) n=1 Tax=Vibrio quintilis TaxID=1117707 RepID=A0A1M7YYQ0_9VIBR|nr:phage tail protein I [Vibrio quintilis]SHO57768.1 Phage tail protein (Tail_P2_I) [Vibrio quintilis]
MNKSLLPVNATTLELDLEQVISRCTDLPVHIKDLWNPETCPLSLLPWLAWALSVDSWDERWPESIKRQVVRDSFEIHRLKGTPYAVQKALDSLNIRMQLREWWEPGSGQSPGTMSVVALINENLTEDNDGLITKTMLEQVVRAIESAKRGVIHFDVELGIALEESLGLAGGIGPSVSYGDQNAVFQPVVPDEAHTEIGIAAAAGPSCDCADKTAQMLPVFPDAGYALAGLAFAGHRISWSDQAGTFSPLTPGSLQGSSYLAGGCWQQCLSDIFFEGTV